MSLILVPPKDTGGGGGGTVDISAQSISDLADAVAAQIAGEALTVNATVSNEVEVKNDAGSPVPVSGTILNTIHTDLDTTLATYLQSIDNGTGANTGALATIDGRLVTIDTHVDGIEGLLGTTNSTLATIDTRVDGLETLIGATNTSLGTIDTHVDGLETLATSTNTKLDTINTTLGTVDTHVDGLETAVASTNTKLDSYLGPIVAEAVMAADGSVLTPGTKYHGFTIKETSGVSVAYVTIHDGANAAAPIIEHIDLLANESRSEFYARGISHGGSLWVEVQSGAASISVRTG